MRRAQEIRIVPRIFSSVIVSLEHGEDSRAGSLNLVLEALQASKSALVAGDESHPVDVIAIVIALREDAATQHERDDSLSLDSFAEQLAQAEKQGRHLYNQITMRDGRQLIEGERTRLWMEVALAAGFPETNTRSITMKVDELTRAYVTEVAGKYFTRETEKLDLKHVTLAIKARQGSIP